MNALSTRSRWLLARQAALRDMASGLSALEDAVRCLASVSFSIAARVAEMIALRVLCGAMGFPLSLPQALFSLVVVNLSVSVPVSVANLGGYEAGLAYGLTRAGMPVPVAVMIATTHHMLELLGITLSAAGYALAYQWTRADGIPAVGAPWIRPVAWPHRVEIVGWSSLPNRWSTAWSGTPLI